MKFFSSRKHRAEKENVEGNTNHIVNGASISSRTGGFEMNHEYSCDYDTLADSTIYTDGCLRSAGPSLGHEAMRIIPESPTAKAVLSSNVSVSRGTPKQPQSPQHSRPAILKDRSTSTNSSKRSTFPSQDHWFTETTTPPASPTGRSTSTRSTARSSASQTMSTGNVSSPNPRAANQSPQSTGKYRFKTLEPASTKGTKKKDSPKKQARRSDDSESSSLHSVSYHDNYKGIQRISPLLESPKKLVRSELRKKEFHPGSSSGTELKSRAVCGPSQSPTRSISSEKDLGFSKSKRDISPRASPRNAFAPVSPVDIDEVSSSSSSSDSSVVLNLVSRINVNDSALLERSPSPGSLRLTEDYLKQHERKCLKEILYEKPLDSLDKWKRKKLADKYYQQTHSEHRDEQALDHRSSSHESSRTHPKQSSEVSSPRRPSLRLFAVPFRKTEADVGDMSLAPLSNMEDLHLTDSVKSKNGRKSGFWPFRTKADSSSTAKDILEKEREAAKVVARLHQEQEKQRIEKKRRLYLEHQRLREAEVAEEQLTSSKSTKSARSIGSIIQKANPTNRDRSFSQDVSTISSTTTPLPLCVMCHTRERSHIATPCMHFSFCATCVEGLQGNESYCPVCFEPDVKFAAVSV